MPVHDVGIRVNIIPLRHKSLIGQHQEWTYMKKGYQTYIIKPSLTWGHIMTTPNMIKTRPFFMPHLIMMSCLSKLLPQNSMTNIVNLTSLSLTFKFVLMIGLEIDPINQQCSLNCIQIMRFLKCLLKKNALSLTFYGSFPLTDCRWGERISFNSFILLPIDEGLNPWIPITFAGTKWI